MQGSHRQWLRLGLTAFAMLPIAWSIMVVTHELGHVVGGVCSGAILVDLDLWPWHLPYSLFQPDPHPLVTLWCGPILGVIVPMTLARLLRRNEAWLVAYFCMLANGVYLAVARVAGDSYLDTAMLLDHGAHPVAIGLFCAVTIGWGYIGFRRSLIRLFGINASPASHSTAHVEPAVDMQDQQRGALDK